MNTGVVKFYNDQKGYGFIQPDNGGKDVFVHATALERAGIRGLVEGQKVGFDTREDRRTGKVAVDDVWASDACPRRPPRGSPLKPPSIRGGFFIGACPVRRCPMAPSRRRQRSSSIVIAQRGRQQILRDILIAHRPQEAPDRQACRPMSCGHPRSRDRDRHAPWHGRPRRRSDSR